MKTKAVANKTQADLVKALAEKREALRLFRFGGAGAKTKNVREGRMIRREIARLLTALNALKAA